MNLDVALYLFKSFEEERFTEMEGDPPVYTVRLDAFVARYDGERDFRVRVTPGPLGLMRDNWHFVIEEAVRKDVELTIDNSGIELV